MPRITLGLPVYNGANYLAAALDSILAQTWTDFELIVSDNASTDATAEIALAYAGQDTRIRYLRQPQNLGAATNFNTVLAAAGAPYFKWAAHDDLLAPTYLARGLATLEAHPSAVLAYPQAILVDAGGTHQRPFPIHLRHMDDLSPAVRLANLLFTPHWALEIFGLMRREILTTTTGIAPYPLADLALLAELALRGPFCTLDAPLFFSRDHAARSVRALPPHRRGAWFDARCSRAQRLPHWRLLRGYLHAIARAPLMHAERQRCRWVVLHWAAARAWPQLALDLPIAALPGLGDALWRLKLRRWRHRTTVSTRDPTTP